MYPSIMARFAGAWAVLAAVLLAGAGRSLAAEDLQLRIDGGRVTLIASGATLADILAEWSRVGDTRFVGADALDGGPLTLHLVDVAEARALGLLLEAAQGYVAAPRRAAAPGTSRYDRVTILAGGRAGGGAAGTAAAAARGGPTGPNPAQPAGGGADPLAADLQAQLERLQGALDGSGGAADGGTGATGSLAGGAGAGAPEPNVALDHLQHLLGAAAARQGGTGGGDGGRTPDAAPPGPITTPFPGMIVEPGEEPPAPRGRRRGGLRGAIPDPFTVVPAPSR